MKKGLLGVAIWVLAFAVVYVAMVFLNSLGAHVQDQSQSYGSSRMYQEISGIARLLIHFVPAVAVGFIAPRFAWQVSGFLSLIAEVSGNLDLFGKDGLPYVGDPVATVITYALLGLLSAYWMSRLRERRTSSVPT